MGTMQVAAKLGTSYWVLMGLLRAGRMTPPAKVGGDYRWSAADVAAARRELRESRAAVSASACAGSA